MPPRRQRWSICLFMVAYWRGLEGWIQIAICFFFAKHTCPQLQHFAALRCLSRSPVVRGGASEPGNVFAPGHPVTLLTCTS
ncbi:hypothetical protein B0T26DRAFT_704233 [Lasiosphaeria miniovina]|uniref:Uncharacterized protein n=1 Tax=Lasiosphaeria miniovina TaxID=1954250 RepID=A0AA40AVR0_9PEZI|nr:uncharacterized protein B0T26DRAFT_704233 [Lasiosphaeria miniovina]KAK0722844.1 hypothetical protein B0T26DRAFT_704233 [Lasiosphaeria miniovina]